MQDKRLLGAWMQTQECISSLSAFNMAFVNDPEHASGKLS